MKKKIFLLICGVVFLGLATGCDSEKTSNNDLSYCFEFDDSTGTITNYFCYEGNEYGYEEISDVVIPEKIDDVEVLSIGAMSFVLKNIDSISLPNTITTIGDMAFQGNNILKIEIPEGVIEIGSFAFARNNLTTVTIPNAVKTIGGEAFKNNNLENVILGSNVESIGNYAFYKDNASNSNVNLNKIINKTNREFNWTDVTGAYIDNQVFATGTVTHELGNIVVE